MVQLPKTRTIKDLINDAMTLIDEPNFTPSTYGGYVITPTRPNTASTGVGSVMSGTGAQGAAPTSAIPPEQQTTIPSSSTPLTYGEWVTSQREQIEANRKQAVIDAQSSYMKNLSTYGANKDRLASSGLANSGYGEYLTSRAYTQMRDDVQAANKLATDANLTLSGQELEHNEALKTKYAQYLSDIANGAYGDANTAGAVGEALGLTAEQTTTGKNMVTDQAVSGYYNAISAGTLNTSEVDKIKDTLDPTVYADLQAKWNDSFKTIGNTFIDEKGELIPYGDAKAMVDEICNNSWATKPTKDALNAVLEKNYHDEFLKDKASPYVEKAKQIITELTGEEKYYGLTDNKIVDINSTDYTSDDWGDFLGNENPDSKQSKYIAALVDDAKKGKIREGQFVATNFGQAWDDWGTYIYVGDGKFVAYDANISNVKSVYNLEDDSVYCPTGYKIKGNGKVKKD